VECALGLCVELVVAGQVPPAKVVSVSRVELREDQDGIRESVKAKGSNDKLTTSHKNEPELLEAIL